MNPEKPEKAPETITENTSSDEARLAHENMGGEQEKRGYWYDRLTRYHEHLNSEKFKDKFARRAFVCIDPNFDADPVLDVLIFDADDSGVDYEAKIRKYFEERLVPQLIESENIIHENSYLTGTVKEVELYSSKGRRHAVVAIELKLAEGKKVINPPKEWGDSDFRYIHLTEAFGFEEKIKSEPK